MNSTDINFAIDVLSHPQSGDESDISMALDIAIKSLKAWRKALEQEPKTGHWTIKQYQVPIKNKQVPTISDIAFLPIEPTACKIVYTYTHSVCKSEEYLNKYNFCPNCGYRMVEPQERSDKE